MNALKAQSEIEEEEALLEAQLAEERAARGQAGKSSDEDDNAAEGSAKNVAKVSRHACVT